MSTVLSWQFMTPNHHAREENSVEGRGTANSVNSLDLLQLHYAIFTSSTASSVRKAQDLVHHNLNFLYSHPHLTHPHLMITHPHITHLNHIHRSHITQLTYCICLLQFIVECYVCSWRCRHPCSCTQKGGAGTTAPEKYCDTSVSY